MAKRNNRDRKDKKTVDPAQTTWVLTSKSVGDKLAGWVIDSVERDEVRYLEASERCKITSFCYPTGAKMVRARLLKAG